MSVLNRCALNTCEIRNASAIVGPAPKLKPRVRALSFGAGPTIADAFLISHVFSAQRFKTDMTPYPEVMAIVENCGALKPFADAHPSQQPDAKG